MTFRSLQLTALTEQLAIARLEPSAAVPDWVDMGAFFSVTRTLDELSIVCSAKCVPAEVPFEGPFLGIKVRGPLEFSDTGVLSSIALPLSEAGVSLFAISTYETDYILVARKDWDCALDVLESAGHRISKDAGSNGAA